ncbi:hypothetical protein GA830_10410 [Mesorhizobium sp. NBSH29]|uniref:hypothetical protein n=1 Tax=Mesorhizobium sp. NBSH29 TaxID=2654249 RepID=UPI0018964C31|nr:hypothetical protein [Mesorhizobium sp. NBSH29]QPC87107.1 hypothetical protein GA830_10410 [Mesorhizobium sp. NBSH29]
MKLELKNIEVNEGMSHETYCYSATLWVDGSNVGTVGNAGHGGCDEQRIEQGMLNGVNAWIANNLPPAFISDDIETSCDLEIWCADQISDHMVERDMNKALKRKVLYRAQGRIYEVPKGKLEMDSLVALLKAKHGDDVPILNLMARDEAITLFKQTDAA